MKKTKILIVVLILIIVVQFGCIIYLNITNPSWDNVTLSIKDGTLSPAGFTLVVNDKNFLTTEFRFNYYSIEQSTFAGWKELVKIRPIESIQEIGIIPKRIPHLYETSLNWAENWAKEIGSLEKGSYRIRFEARYDGLGLETPTTLFVNFKI